MSQCQCRALPGGDKVICDSCASHMIEMLNDVVVSSGQPHEILPVLTATEFAGLQSAVNVWMHGLQSEQETRAW